MMCRLLQPNLGLTFSCKTNVNKYPPPTKYTHINLRRCKIRQASAFYDAQMAHGTHVANARTHERKMKEIILWRRNVSFPLRVIKRLQ